MCENKGRQNVSGTVLIMILTVMLVLIVMLLATLTVVSTASQRIYTKYEENQAYYTARSALDVFSENVLNDASYYSSAAETQGFAIQKQLYTVKSLGDPGDNSQNVDIYGTVTKDCLMFTTALPELAGETSSGAQNYSNFGDSSTTDVPNPITIKVEVLNRYYDAGPDNTIGTADDNRKKDIVQIKVTSTATVMGVERTAAAIYGSKKPSANKAERAVTVEGNNNMNVSNTTILGGLATKSGTFAMGNNGDYWGNIFIGGTVNVTGSGSRLVSTDNQWIYFENGLTIQNNLPIEGRLVGSDLSKTPNMYVNGNLNIPNNTTTGYDSATSTPKPIKIVVAGDLNANANQYTHYGDLYVLGNVTGGLQLTVNGNLYVMGSCNLGSAQNGITVTGNLYHGGSFSAPMEGTPPHYKSNVLIGNNGLGGTSGLINSAPPSTIVEISGNDYAADPSTAPQSWDGNVVVKWNGAEYKISTKKKLYTQFHRYGDVGDGTITASEFAFLSEDELDALMDPATTSFTYPTDYKRIHEYINANSASATPVSIAASPTITDCTKKYTLTPGHCGGATLTIDAGGEVEMFLTPGSYQNGGTILVKNGSTLKIFGAPGNYSFDKIKISTEDVENGNDLYVGETAPSGHSLMSIPISYYFEGESSIQINNDGSLFVGHFYAPRATVTATGGCALASSNNVYYNGVQYDRPGANFTFVGSLLCDEYTVGDNKGGVAFVKSSATVNTPGMPTLSFQPQQYLNK